jgi:hypothetical protein
VRLTNKLLGYLHRVFNKDPMQFLALRITCDSGQMTWAVSDGFLTLTPANSNFAQPMMLDLSTFTVQSLGQFVASQPGYLVLFQDSSTKKNLSALVLLDATGDVSQSNGDHLFGYTNLLYAYVNATASELELLQAQIGNALQQMSTTTAEAEFLDFQGTFYDVPRNSVGSTSELDTSYSPRIISNVLLPSSNNFGMAIALEAQFPGTQVVITDAVTTAGTILLRDGSIFFNSEFVHNSTGSTVAGGLFDVTFAFSFSGPITFEDYAPLVIAAVNKYRLGGTNIRNLFLKNGLTATVPITNFTLGVVLVTVFDQAAAPIQVLTTESGLTLTTESGIDIQI